MNDKMQGMTATIALTNINDSSYRHKKFVRNN